MLCIAGYVSWCIVCQVGAALRPAFAPETAPDVTAAACQVHCHLFIHCFLHTNTHSNLHLTTSEVSCWSGGRIVTELSLYYSIVYHCNGTSCYYRLISFTHHCYD